MSSSPPNPEMPVSTESMRTCLGRTPTFKRCGNPPGQNKRFCHHHRYQPWVFVLFLLTLTASLAGLYQDAIKPWFVDDATEQKLARMEEQRDKLQTERDKKRQQIRQLVGGVGMAARWADSLAETNPAIAAHAKALKALTKEFEAEVALEKLSKVDNLRFRLIKATLANAQHRYADVPILVPVEEVVAEFEAAKKQIERAELQTDRAIDANQALGDGFSGLRKWRQALACYERILELRPDRWNTRNDVAICLVELGQLPDAGIHLGEIVAHFTALVEQEGRTELANDLATSLNNRGTNLYTQGKLDEANKDYDKAIEISTRLVEQEGRSELAIELGVVLYNRGSTLSTQGNLNEAIKDLDKAIEIYTRLIEQEGRSELANYLAKSLSSRGMTLSAQGKLDGTVKDFDKAIEILTRLVEQEGRTELANDLAMSLSGRGITLYAQGKLDGAIKDFDKAIEIQTRLVEQEGRTELAVHLAASLDSRGDTLNTQGKLDNAIKDYDKAIEIFARLVEQEGRTEFRDLLVYPLVGRGLALRQQGKSKKATEDITKAVGILEQLVSEGQSEQEEKLHYARGILADLKKQEPDE